MFLGCSFGMVSAPLVGRQDEAARLMDGLKPVADDVGVLAEVLEPAAEAFVGNLPQALSHLALVNAAITISTDER
ncbi:MAG: hypothetical protein JWP61_436 [Friedmanniella sp.]|nr:hypothetical protein [Friedmanniella sp.]